VIFIQYRVSYAHSKASAGPAAAKVYIKHFYYTVTVVALSNIMHGLKLELYIYIVCITTIPSVLEELYLEVSL